MGGRQEGLQGGSSGHGSAVEIRGGQWKGLEVEGKAQRGLGKRVSEDQCLSQKIGLSRQGTPSYKGPRTKHMARKANGFRHNIFWEKVLKEKEQITWEVGENKN